MIHTCHLRENKSEYKELSNQRNNVKEQKKGKEKKQHMSKGVLVWDMYHMHYQVCGHLLLLPVHTYMFP